MAVFAELIDKHDVFISEHITKNNENHNNHPRGLQKSNKESNVEPTPSSCN